MGGKEARDGFWFQDAKALTRLLDDALERRRRRVLGLDLEPELEVRVEAAVEVENDHQARQPESHRPTWDGTFVVGEQVTVDECKLGGAEKEDRLTLYRRLRETIASGVPVGCLVPRLTVGRDSETSHETWCGVGATARDVTWKKKLPKRVTSAEDLAREALYYLTTPRPRWKTTKKKQKSARSTANTPALSPDDARALLSRFEFDDSSTIEGVEQQIKEQLSAVGADLAVDTLVRMLRGWIDEEARAREQRRALTADSLAASLNLVSRYLTVDPCIEQLWHRLRCAVPPTPVTMIAAQPWREVQPHIDEVVGGRAARRVVFTSEGGVGKSFLLTELYAEQKEWRVWVDAAVPLQNLEAALALGAWAAHRSKEALTVFVDAIEQVGDPAALLGAIDRSLGGDDQVAVYVASRSATWADVRDRLPRWREVQLARWSDDRVRGLVQVGRASPLTEDLVNLLRTPLLLDLFLRTFGTGDAVPAGLATRHGVLGAYFERRVYAGQTATARRCVLDAGVDAVLGNHVAWRDGTPAAQQLISEGVIVSVFGELRFRHALLRDFSVALQLSRSTVRDIVGKLGGVTSPIIRNELLRGIIEALLAPEPILGSPSVGELVGECAHQGVTPGVALGMTDAPTPALLTAIAAIDGGTVLRQAMTYAHLIGNRSWLRTPGELGAPRPGWLGGVQLEAMAESAQLAVASGDVASVGLASTLQAWAWGRQVSREEEWPIIRIGTLLVRFLPDDTTARWYSSLAFGDTPSKGRFLEQLRDLGASPQVADEALSGALDKVVFGAGSDVLDDWYSLWEVTELCLSDSGGNPGLLTSRPYVALALLFRLSVERKLQEHRHRSSLLQDAALSGIFASLPPPPVDLVAAEERLRIEPTLTDVEAVGDLVDDAPISDRLVFNDVERLMEEAAQRGAEDVTFAEALAEAAIASRSVHARIIALALRGSTRLDDISLGILLDPRMYHFGYASGALWNALHARWPTLAPDVRSKVQRNILERARSPLLPFTEVGRLACAIPREDLEPELEPYVAFLEASGRSTAPRHPAREQELPDDLEDDDSEDHAANPKWRRFENLADRESDQVAAKEALAMLSVGAADLTAETSGSTWVAVALLLRRDVRQDDRALDAGAARTLFEAVLAAIASRRADSGLWGVLLEVADACPRYCPEQDALEMRTMIIDEIVAGAGAHAERQEHARCALTVVRPISWFSGGTGGRAVFESWFRDSLDGKGLQASLRMLSFGIRCTNPTLTGAAGARKLTTWRSLRQCEGPREQRVRMVRRRAA